MHIRQYKYFYNWAIYFFIIEERISDIEGLIENFDDKIQRLTCYKSFQELAEAIFYVIAMAIKDKGKLVEDDYNNLDKFEKLGMISHLDVQILQETNWLR